MENKISVAPKPAHRHVHSHVDFKGSLRKIEKTVLIGIGIIGLVFGLAACADNAFYGGSDQYTRDNNLDPRAQDAQLAASAQGNATATTPTLTPTTVTPLLPEIVCSDISKDDPTVSQAVKTAMKQWPERYTNSYGGTIWVNLLKGNKVISIPLQDAMSGANHAVDTAHIGDRVCVSEGKANLTGTDAQDITPPNP